MLTRIWCLDFIGFDAPRSNSISSMAATTFRMSAAGIQPFRFGFEPDDLSVDHDDLSRRNGFRHGCHSSPRSWKRCGSPSMAQSRRVRGRARLCQHLDLDDPAHAPHDQAPSGAPSMSSTGSPRNRRMVGAMSTRLVGRPASRCPNAGWTKVRKGRVSAGPRPP